MAAIAQRTPDEIVLRLEAERVASAPLGAPLLAFDGDGTLWSGDVGVDAFEALVASEGVREEATAALAEEAAAFGVSATGSPSAIAMALYRAYEAGGYPEPRAFAMMSWVFAGRTHPEVVALVREVLTARFAARAHTELAAVLRWARAAGVETLVVSASPRAVVEVASGALGFSPADVLAMTPEVAGGRLAPRLAGELIYADGKLRALRAHRPGSVILGAFGDSAYDAAMLAAARVPVAVRMTPGLLRVADTVPGLCEVARPATLR